MTNKINIYNSNEALKQLKEAKANFIDAIQGHHNDIVETMLSENIVAVSGYKFQDAVERALYAKNAEALQLLIDYKANISRDVYEIPINNNWVEGLEILLNQTDDVEQLDRSRNSILSEACECGSVEMVKLLIERGADVNSENHYSYTPIFRAGWERMPVEGIKMLLKAGANPHIETSFNGKATKWGKVQIAMKEIEEELASKIRENIKKNPKKSKEKLGCYDPIEEMRNCEGKSEVEIKKVYHRICKIYHPDVNDGKTAEFKKIKDIYEDLIEGI